MMKNSNNSIGIFDSGVGGTSIWKEINRLLPNEHTIYLADSKNAPYGIKKKETIIELCEKNTEWLLNRNCKIIIVACNTATTNAIKHLRSKYSVPFIGIEPAIKPASLKTKNKSVGILATKGTLSSELFIETSSLYSEGIRLTEQHGTGLVELIETGKINSEEMDSLLNDYLKPMIRANIDYLVLGCSHYPYLIPLIQKILNDDVNIIDSGQAVAAQTKAVLENLKIINNTKETTHPEFHTNGNAQVLINLLKGKHKVTETVF